MPEFQLISLNKSDPWCRILCSLFDNSINIAAYLANSVVLNMVLIFGIEQRYRNHNCQLCLPNKKMIEKNRLLPLAFYYSSRCALCSGTYNMYQTQIRYEIRRFILTEHKVKLATLGRFRLHSKTNNGSCMGYIFLLTCLLWNCIKYKESNFSNI